MSSFKDYYATLGINFSATETDIKTGYRKMARLFHPDMHPEDTESYTARFQEITAAYETLSDSYKKELYDQQFRYNILGETAVVEQYYYEPEFQYEDYQPPIASKRKSYASYAIFLFLAIYVIRMISNASIATTGHEKEYSRFYPAVHAPGYFPEPPKDTLDLNTVQQTNEQIKKPF